MDNPRIVDGPSPAEAYDAQSPEYIAFADSSYTWNYIEKPGFDMYIPDLYTPETAVLDIGSGTGRVVKHLIAKGLNTQNIVGLEPSLELVRHAQAQIPDVAFIQGAATELPFRSETFDLLTANMVFHHLDNVSLASALDRMYEVLKPGGTLFFVGIDPDHSAETLGNINKWVPQQTPWGSEIPAFNHDMYEMLLDSMYFAGFDRVAGWQLGVSEDGKVDPDKYAHYSGQPSRLAARFSKVSASQKANRLKHAGEMIPSWSD
ncbi:MAG TPA: class I SAM-dependent methyltransferase [Candidatus Saccharibacteria bacterium]|nr:class I SAM-dependent methyltransferase [Candidatus Saccharibacteria bacterium]